MNAGFGLFMPHTCHAMAIQATPVIRCARFGLVRWFGMVLKNTTEQELVLSAFYHVPGTTPVRVQF
jgi:hypothetical protein